MCRIKFKQAIRKCKKDKETIIADIIAEKMFQKDPRKFWKDVKHRVDSKSDENIESMWKHHDKNIFNSVRVFVIKLTFIYLRITLARRALLMTCLAISARNGWS